MYLIVGLGNPEEDYSNTRHNMGFDTINEIAKRYNINITKKKFKGLYEICNIEGQKVVLLKPQTFMNLSGESIKEIVQYYDIPIENMLVIYDDMDIEKGAIKIRKKGGPGSHNGMKSIVENLGSKEFPRIRIGIGKPDNEYDKINYVIGYVSKEEMEILEEGVKKAADAVIEILKNDVDTAMNKFN